MRFWVLLAALFIAPVHGFATPPLTPAEHLEEWLPAEVALVGRFRNLGGELRTLLDSEAFKKLLESPGYVRRAKDPAYTEFLAGLERIRALTGKPLEALIGEFLGKEFVIGAQPAFGLPNWVLISREPEPGSFPASIAAIREPIAARLGAWPFPEEESYKGVAIQGAGQFHYALLGDALIAGNSVAQVRAVIEIASGERASLKASPDYGEIGSELQKSGVAVLCARRLDFLQNMIPERSDNFVGGLLAGSWLTALRDADFLSLRFVREEAEIQLELGAKAVGLSDKLACFFPKIAPSQLLAKLQRQELLSWLQIHRDYVSYWKQAERLVKQEAMGEMRQFEQVISLVFGGRSFEGEVLGAMRPTITVVAQNQSYAALGGQPLPAIPGVAGILEIQNSPSFGRRLLAGLQSFVSIINFDRAQKGKPEDVLLVEEETLEGVTMYTANRVEPPAPGTSYGMEYNYSPTLAIVGDYVIISSAKETAAMLVRELKGVRPTALTGAFCPGDSWVVRASALEAILRDNAAALAANAVLEQGIALEQAQAELEGALQLLKFARDFRLETRLDGDTLRIIAALRPAKGSI